MNSILSKVAVATVVALGTSSVSAASLKPTVEANEGNRYIVKFRDVTSFNGKNQKASQASIKASVKAVGGNVVLSLDKLGAAAFVAGEKAVAALRAHPNVEYIEVDAPRTLQGIYNDDLGDPSSEQLTPYAIYQSQADQVTLNMSNAKTVCVVDSGIAGSQGETGGFNADFDWSVITGTNDSGTGNWNADGGAHGTHVAGTVAAADNGFGVVGMAPGNPMHIIKVFNDAGWGYSSDLAKAASDCISGGADIITMSLGGGRANRTEENAFASFVASGGLVLAAAGNGGSSTRSYPAGYEAIMMVGANDANNNIADFSQYPSCRSKGKTKDGYCVEVTAGGVATLSTYPSGTGAIATLAADSVSYETSAMENLGSASGNTYDFGLGTAVDSAASGKICVIQRGDISFHDKVLNCENSGGVGAIIYNNVSGLFGGTLGDTNQTSIPAVTASMEDGAALVASTSASISAQSSDWGYMDGTSMATPGVAGVAALVWSNHPSCSGEQIRAALKATAEDSGAAGKDVYFGYGIVKAKAAHDYLTANGC